MGGGCILPTGKTTVPHQKKSLGNFPQKMEGGKKARVCDLGWEGTYGWERQESSPLFSFHVKKGGSCSGGGLKEGKSKKLQPVSQIEQFWETLVMWKRSGEGGTTRRGVFSGGGRGGFVSDGNRRRQPKIQLGGEGPRKGKKGKEHF